MYEYDINTPLPDPDYRGPIFGPDWKPAERETFAEALDRKCTEVHETNESYRKSQA